MHPAHLQENWGQQCPTFLTPCSGPCPWKPTPQANKLDGLTLPAHVIPSVHSTTTWKSTAVRPQQFIPSHLRLNQAVLNPCAGRGSLRGATRFGQVFFYLPSPATASGWWHYPPAPVGCWPFHSHGSGLLEINGFLGILAFMWRNHPHLHRFFFAVPFVFYFDNGPIQAKACVFDVTFVMGSLSVTICFPSILPGLISMGSVMTCSQS